MKNSTNQRLEILDCVRGLACFIVLVGHCLSVFNWDTRYLKTFGFFNLTDGRSAVTFFFVLSGFVLTYPNMGKTPRPLNIPTFFIKRFTRIWLPWFAVFLMAMIAQNVFFDATYSLDEESAYFYSDHHKKFWDQQDSFTIYLKQMLFLHKDVTTALLPHDWSLRVELRAAIIIPVLFLISRFSLWALLFSAGGLLLLIPSTGYYYASFVVGIFVCFMYRFNYGGIVNSRFRSLWCLLLGIILYQAQWVSEVYPSLLSGTRDIWMIASLGCGLIMISLLGNIPMKWVIKNNLFSYLGKVSYSLYLIHFVVLMCFSGVMINLVQKLGVPSVYVNQLLFVVLMTTICLVLADISERYIEKPCIKLGRFLSELLHRKLPNLKMEIPGLLK